jgi:hypothetical protein
MAQDQPDRDAGAENPDVQRGDDYEYDEAHDGTAGRVGATPPPPYAGPPAVDLGVGGDYGYDEAHDLGIR